MPASQRKSRHLSVILTYLGLITLSVFSTGPILWMVLTSLKTEADIVTGKFEFLPSHLTIDNYLSVWRQSNFPLLAMNSTIITAITVAICLATGTLAAYSFSRFRFPAHNRFAIAYLVFGMFPVVVMIAPLYILMRQLGAVDTKIGLAVVYSGYLLPLFVWIQKSFFDAVPIELESAARIDGASRLGAMVWIAIPLARTGLVATSAFIAISAWNEFLFALMLTSGRGSRTWPVGLQLMIGESQLPWGLLAAGGTLAIIPVALFFGLMQSSLLKRMRAARPY